MAHQRTRISPTAIELNCTRCGYGGVHARYGYLVDKGAEVVHINRPVCGALRRQRAKLERRKL